MVVAAGCLVVLLVALPFVIGRLALDVERTLEPERVTVGDRAIAVVRVTNPRRTPISSRTIEDHVGGRPLRLDIPPLGAGRSTEAVYTLPTARRGVVTVGPALIVKSDLLGLMRREIVQTGTQTLWVHPRVRALAPLPVGFAKDLEGPTSDASPAGDVAFHALREYELGDDHRHIHWMSSARTGTLMVRHHVDNRRPNLTVVVDTEIGSYPSVRAVRHGHRDRRLARCVVDGQRATGRHLARRRGRHGASPPGDAQHAARPPHARRRRRRHRRLRQRPARLAHGDRHIGARRRHRQRPDGALPPHGHRRPPRRREWCSCGCGRRATASPVHCPAARSSTSTTSTTSSGVGAGAVIDRAPPGRPTACVAGERMR